ncbi:MAG: hypothetical protein A2107_09490 [Verrucomicrobia bacterium GWF2_62_7]|nr:MAG: hypothetical protein A2107_09490 [Verrucomicrobia bacterium GWF2_62_7]
MLKVSAIRASRCFFLALAMLGLGNAALAADQPKIPACMIVDDPAPFINMRSVKDTNVCREIPTQFYIEFGQWAERSGVKGKFSVVPCLGGIKAIDGSLGEYPGHTREERLEWIAMIRKLYAPRFTITPEVITHWLVWDIAAKRLKPSPTTENEWLAAQPLEIQTQYIAEAMRMLKSAGIEPGGLTMCWNYPKEKNAILGEAAVRAAEKVLGLKYVMVFNDTGEQPGVIYRGSDGATAVSLRPAVTDVYDHTFGKKTEQDILHDADRYITADGQRGSFVEQIRKGKCLIFYTHAQTLYGNGTKSGFRVFQMAIERLRQHYRDRIEWMTGLEVCRKFCPPRGS